ncbi:MAG: iron-sulfur cluster-binding domain-containing protein [Clostridia bacterium]|nr:iron-sulfur cluster-binding domain-containing protein [Clostridia bacterium]
MSKPNIRSLSKLDFLKMIPARKQIIEEAPAQTPPPLDSYKANELAKQLHPDFQFLKVSQVIERGEEVKSFVLVPDQEKGCKKLAYFSAGQYLVIPLKIGNAKLVRPYSLSSSPKESLQGKYEITVKRVEGGLASQYILDHWQVGTQVRTIAPEGLFTYEPLRDAKHIVGLAGGCGITPFVSLAKAIAEGDEDACLTLIYGCRTNKDILFKAELEELAQKCEKIKLIYVLSDEPSEGCENGFITADIIRKHAPKSEEYSIFICGPQAMYDFADQEIAKLGLRKKFIRHEVFGEYRNPARDAEYPEVPKDSFKLKVFIRGESTTIDCNANDTLLNSMEKNGIAAPAHCRSGICGWCHSKLLSGEVYVPKTVDGRRLADFDYGYIHPCCSFPLSDVEIEVYPR